MTKAAHLHAVEPAQTPRQALAAALADQAAVGKAQAALQAQIDAAQSAQSDLAAAEQAWRDFTFEDGLRATPDDATRLALKAAVLEARERAKPMHDAQAKLEHLNN